MDSEVIDLNKFEMTAKIKLVLDGPSTDIVFSHDDIDRELTDIERAFVLAVAAQSIAKGQGMTIQEVCRRVLGARTMSPMPANVNWARGLSVRALNCLLGAGFHSAEEVIKARNDGYKFGRLPNAGPKIEAEIIWWCGTINFDGSIK